MKISNYYPSWPTVLGFGGIAIGSLAGLVSRVAHSASWIDLNSSNRTLCQAGFDYPMFDGINTLGQWEIETIAILSSALVPLAAKISYDAYFSQEKTVLARVSEALKKNLSFGQGAAIALTLGLGCGVTKPMLNQIWKPIISKTFNPSGHFFTRILAAALGTSILNRSFQKNDTAKKVSVAWYAFNGGKDAVLLFGTLANHCHSLPEGVAGSLVASLGLSLLSLT